MGILDAEALLGAPLPDRAEVEGNHRLALEEVATTEPAGERVATLFPDPTADEVTRRPSTLWGTSGDALAVELERHEAELARIFSKRRQAWDAFMDTTADGPVRAAGVDASTAFGAEPDTLVAQFSSPTLVGSIEANQRTR